MEKRKIGGESKRDYEKQQREYMQNNICFNYFITGDAYDGNENISG